MIPFKPLQDVVAVQTDARERVLASGLVIPHVADPDRQTADERDIGLVVAAGDGKRINVGRRPMSVHVGDRVVFGRNKGQLIRYAEVDYCILREEHLIGRMGADGFEPLGGYIVASTLAPAGTTAAGVIVPEGDRDEARVLMVGPGEIQPDGSLEVPIVKVGDTILFNPRMAEPFEHGGRELLALRQAHIVCISDRPGG